MSDHVYKTVELTGSSTKGIEDATERAIDVAAKSIRSMRWFEVTDIRGHIDDANVKHWQVTVKVGFTIEQS